MEKLHRDRLGHLTQPPQGVRCAPCGHPMLEEPQHGERCAYCADYEEAVLLDQQAAAAAVAEWFSV